MFVGRGLWATILVCGVGQPSVGGVWPGGWRPPLGKVAGAERVKVRRKGNGKQTKGRERGDGAVEEKREE